MGSSPSDKDISDQDIFEIRRIRRLIELMNEHDLSEMNLQQGDVRIQLRRSGKTLMAPPAPTPAAGHGATGEAPLAQPVGNAGDAPPEALPSEEHIALITSPMVGTFYSSPDPDTAAYVSVGDSVAEETTVCIVEAMKVFNEIQADVSGKIVAVLVESGEPVEFGQPMFKVDPRG